MRRPLLIAIAGLALAAPAADAAETCAPGPPARAATALFGPGTELVSTLRIAGLDTALALEPRIAPGTRRRMVAAPGGRWCDAATGFNEAAAGRDARETAVAFAQVAAAPYFDEVTVRAAEQLVPGTFRVRTHALTNGVEAEWLVATDERGVRAARWTATAFARKPFRAEMEGLTALPGLSERFERVAGGVLREARGLPRARRSGPLDDAGVTYEAPDGMRIVISYGDARFAPDLGRDTGAQPVDIIRQVERATRENYEEFLAWGLTKGWAPAEVAGEPDTGYVYINDALSAACIACVFIADDFQIHLSSEVVRILGALGYSYPDAGKAFSNVLGHEMFHNFQNRYTKPGLISGFATDRRRGNTSTAYSEGTARFQETLHDYSDASHYTDSLVYAQNTNGCNGFDGSGTSADMDKALAAGVFGKTYNACFFWLPFYANNGEKAFLRLVTEAMPEHSPTADVHKEGLAAVTQATGKDASALLLEMAVSALSGRGNAWGPLAGEGEALDWSKYLEEWRPATLAPGSEAQRSLANGGLMGARVREALTVSLDGTETSRLFEVRDDGRKVTTKALDPMGAPVAAPGDDERVWVVAVHPETGPAAHVLRAG